MFFLMRMRTRKAQWLAMLFAALLLCVRTGALAEQRLVRVGVFENAPQVSFLDDGRVEGIFVDVLEAIAMREGWSIKYVRGSLSEGLARLQSGRIDLMAGVAGAADRQASFSFHQEPVLHSWSQVYARRGSGIRTILDLSGRRVALLDGSVQQAIFVQLAREFNVHVTVLPFRDYATSLAAVVSGEADAFVTNPLFGRLRARPAGLEDTAIVFAPMTMHFASAKNAQPALLQAIDRHLLAMKADPTSGYFASVGRWTRTDDEPRLPPWF